MSDGTESVDTANVVPAEREFVTSISAAARALNVTARTIRNWRTEGCHGFEPDGRVDLVQVRAWSAKRLEVKRGSLDAREEKLLEEIRKLKLANDHKEGRLIERAWVAERMQRAAGELNTLRSKWESEMPLKFAETNGDIVECREILRGVLDEIFRGLQSLGTHFEEERRQ